LARVRSDPEELRKFARVILDETDEMEEAFNRLKRGFDSISGESWQDSQRDLFEEVLESAAHTLAQFVEDVRGQVDSIHRKADILEDYLSDRR